LKLVSVATGAEIIIVTPLAGVWIEINSNHENDGRCHVTPLAGVWIEISQP